MVCCFTGHRSLPKGSANLINARLHKTIEYLIGQGVSEFRTGGAIGFDTLAAFAVLKLKEQYPHISLVLMLPCKDQDKGWTDLQKRCYKEIINCADQVNILSEHYYRGCMFARNRALVDGSDYCVAYLTQAKGGTQMTVDYAQRKNLKIINLGQ